jgi:glycerol-3-phosphate acyltransferase PlsX
MRRTAKDPVSPQSIGIDLLGSDLPPETLLRAILSFSSELDEKTHLVLLGTPNLFQGISPPSSQITFHPVSEIIEMHEPPLAAIRQKKDSSLCKGIRLLKEEKLKAFISAGNTGALMGCAAIELKRLPRIKKPALLALLPTKKGEIAVLDVGANTSCKPENLLQFASMGTAFQKSRGIERPRVGLLNMGTESSKGPPALREAYDLLSKADSFHFVGNVEGRDAFEGHIDVLVVDGFTGNIFLKTAEGIATVILEELEAASDPAAPFVIAMQRKLHYREHPGAILCGVNGLVIKCHGAAGAQSLTRSIKTAARLIEHGFLSRIKEQL